MNGVLLVLLALLLGGTLTGCGRDPWVVDRDRVLRLEIREYRISPQRIRVQAGRVVILARNEGRLLHALELINDEDARGGRRRAYVRVPSVRPGQRLRPIRVTLPPGRFRLIDPLQNFEDLGMTADLEVLPAGDPALDEEPRPPRRAGAVRSVASAGSPPSGQERVRARP